MLAKLGKQDGSFLEFECDLIAWSLGPLDQVSWKFEIDLDNKKLIRTFKDVDVGNFPLN